MQNTLSIRYAFCACARVFCAIQSPLLFSKRKQYAMLECHLNFHANLLRPQHFPLTIPTNILGWSPKVSLIYMQSSLKKTLVQVSFNYILYENLISYRYSRLKKTQLNIRFNLNVDVNDKCVITMCRLATFFAGEAKIGEYKFQCLKLS